MQECYGVRNLRVVDVVVWSIEYYKSRKRKSKKFGIAEIQNVVKSHNLCKIDNLMKVITFTVVIVFVM